jgi:hypothetical protein
LSQFGALFRKNTQMSPKSSQIDRWGMQLRLLSVSTRYVLRFVTISAVFALSANLEYWHKWCIHHKNSSKIHQTKVESIWSHISQKHAIVTQIVPNWGMSYAIVILVYWNTVCATLCEHKCCICIKCKSRILTHMMHSSSLKHINNT